MQVGNDGIQVQEGWTTSWMNIWVCNQLKSDWLFSQPSLQSSNVFLRGYIISCLTVTGINLVDTGKQWQILKKWPKKKTKPKVITGKLAYNNVVKNKSIISFFQSASLGSTQLWRVFIEWHKFFFSSYFTEKYSILCSYFFFIVSFFQKINPNTRITASHPFNIGQVQYHSAKICWTPKTGLKLD